MTQAHRKHISISPQAVRYLEEFRSQRGLGSFSDAVEQAVLALQAQELRREYERFAQDYAADPEGQQEAEEWLNLPMDEG